MWLLQDGDVLFCYPFPTSKQIIKHTKNTGNICEEAGVLDIIIKLHAWESTTEITGSSNRLWNKESHRPLAVVASGPAPPLVLLLLGGAFELVNSAAVVGDNLLAAGVDWGGGGAPVDPVGGSPEVLSVGAWPGVAAVSCTVTVGTSAAPVDVSFDGVCPCVRATDSLETSGKVEACN